jgi:hypothetical protein
MLLILVIISISLLLWYRPVVHASASAEDLQKTFEEVIRKKILAKLYGKRRFPKHCALGSSITANPFNSIHCTELMEEDFSYLRQFFGYALNNEELVRAFSKELLFTPSLGDSDSFCLYTSSRKFMIKTITQKEYAKLCKMLPDYCQHFQTTPKSLLPSFLGVFRFDHLETLDKTYFPHDQYIFLLMENVFYDYELEFASFEFKGDCSRKSNRNGNIHIENIPAGMIYRQMSRASHGRCDTDMLIPPLMETEFRTLKAGRALDPLAIDGPVVSRILCQINSDLEFLSKNSIINHRFGL